MVPHGLKGIGYEKEVWFTERERHPILCPDGHFAGSAIHGPLTDPRPDGPPSIEEAWRSLPDRLLPAARAIDLIAAVGLFACALLFLYPLAPHYEISSDSMDPFSHAWRIWTGRAEPFSSHNLLYAWGRAWTHLPLLLVSDSLVEMARWKAVVSATEPVFVYLAARVLLGGTSPGPGGRPQRRFGAFVGPLVGALVLVRFPGLMWSQAAGSHVYFSGEWSAAALLPAAVLLRVAGIGGGDGPPPPPSRLVTLAAAAALVLSLGFAPLNHPYALGATAVAVPIAALLGLRARRWKLAAGLIGGLALLGLPHALTLLDASGSVQLVEYARSDAEFGYLTWSEGFQRLVVERTESPVGQLLWQGPFIALLVGGLALLRRRRLATLVLTAAGLAWTAFAVELGMTRISQHIQPYHWRPLMPWFALALGVGLGAVIDLGLRRSRDERAADVTAGRGLPAAALRQAPWALGALALLVWSGERITRNLLDDHTSFRELWTLSVPRQAWYHDHIVNRMVQAERDGRLPVLAGVDLPEFSVVLDPLAMAFATWMRGYPIEEYARAPAPGEPMLLHMGLGGTDPLGWLDAHPDGLELVEGDELHLLLTGPPEAFRRWTARLCTRRPGPPRLVLPEDTPEAYRLRGRQEMRHLTVDGELYVQPYVWAHPCTDPFAWPDLEFGEYPVSEPGADLRGIQRDQIRWANLGPVYIARTETPRGDWARCVAEGVCRPGPEEGGAWLPVLGVTADEALGYCRWLVDGVEREGRIWDGDLPNRAEWEAAASFRHSVSEVPTHWPWGDSPDESAANGAWRRGPPGPTEVGSFPAGSSPQWLEDAAGNAAEWVRDASLPGMDSSEPWGASLPGLLLAGGSFRSDMDAVAVSSAVVPAPDRPLDDVGFRCAVRARPEDSQ